MSGDIFGDSDPGPIRVSDAGSSTVKMRTWCGRTDRDAEMLRQIAAFIDEPFRVLLCIQSTGFGEPWETTLQVFYADDPTTEEDIL